MKNIKIKELSASNFRGQNFKDTYGNTNFISGRNSAGKSTRIAAWNWLICGCCSANEVANYNLFDNRIELSPETPTACVESVIDIDGTEYTLKRTATAAFTRKRGTSEIVKNASDTYKYYVDNIEYNATEFRGFLTNNVAPDDMLKYVLSGEYFVDLVFSEKKRARAIIEKTVGTVERSEMEGDYADIDELLEKYSPDQIEERCKNLSKSIDARLNEIPTVISQKEAEISEIEQTDFASVQNEIDTLESEQKSVLAQIFDYAARMKPMLEAKAKAEGDKRMKQEVYDKAKKTYMQGLIDTENGIIREISEAEDCNRVALKNKEEAETDLTIQQNFVAHGESELAKLREERDRIKATKEEVCPVCGNAVSGEKLEEHKRKAIDDIVSHAKGLSEELDKTKEKKLKAIYMKKGLQSRLSSLKNDVGELRIEQREKGAELAKYERQRQLVKDYKQEQMEILSHKVNDGLKSSRIECWSQQKDGQIVPDIVLKNKDGVNFATANGASRIVTTCDIQRFFCEKIGVSMPMFIDESSIIQTSNLPHFDGVQTFYLFCSDEPLKIETK